MILMNKFTGVLFVTLALLLSPPAASAQEGGDAGRQDDETIKVDTNLVSMPVVVTNREGVYVPDMRKEEFAVSEDGVEQQVVFFATTTQPFHVVLMLDTSGSTEEKLAPIQQAAAAFVEQLQSADKVKVISFDDEVRELNEFTGDHAEARRAIMTTKPGKGTKLYDAVQLAFDRLKRVKGRKAVVIFTDGVDYRSSNYMHFQNLRALEESDVIVYPIRFDTRAETERLARKQAREGQGADLASILSGGSPRGATPTTFPGEDDDAAPTIAKIPFPTTTISRPRTDRNDPRQTGRPETDSRFPDPRDDRSPAPEPERDDGIGRMLDTLYKTADDYLGELVRKSGGKLVRADTVGMLPAAFKEIAAELRTQYSIGYYPSNATAKGGYRKVKVRASRKGSVVRARPGYTAAKARA